MIPRSNRINIHNEQIFADVYIFEDDFSYINNEDYDNEYIPIWQCPLCTYINIEQTKYVIRIHFIHQTLITIINDQTI